VESTLNRLRKNPGDFVNYHKEIQQLIDSEFVEEASMGYEELHTHLPHHPVYRVDKSTTKIRPVFDGAAKTKFGPSLNDVLETGPNLNPDLLWVLMRFRKHKIAWIADIEKAFLNIPLQPEDAEAIKFLWPKEPEIPYFSLKIFSDAQLNMRSWATNSEELRPHLKEKRLSKQVVGLLSSALDGQQKGLGIRWDTGSDSFQFDPTSFCQAVEEAGTEITKRKILGISARIFDPIGFLAPTVLLLKIIYQKLWEKEVGWELL
jgi:Pao retrotransposon peptidase